MATANIKRTQPHWVSVQYTADYLNFSRRTIENMIADGRLKAYRVNGSRTIRLRLDEVEAAMQPFGGAVA